MKSFGLTVCILKTKGQAMDAISEGDVCPVEVGSGMIEMVKTFTCLGSNLSSDCEATCEVTFVWWTITKAAIPWSKEER